MRTHKRKRNLGVESLESRMVLQGVGGNPFDELPPDPPFDTPPVDVPPAPPTNGRPVIVHPLGGPGRPGTIPPDPTVPPFGDAPEAMVVDVPGPPSDIPPVDLPDQVPDDVPPPPPTNGRPTIVHPLGGPGRPDTVPPDPNVPPFGDAPEAMVVDVPGPPSDIPPVDLPDAVPDDVPPPPPTNGRPTIVHPLGGPGRPGTVPPDPIVPPFGDAPEAMVVDVPGPPSNIPPVDLPDQVPDDVPPPPPTNGRPTIVHPLGGPGRPGTIPPDPTVPPFGDAPEAIVAGVSRNRALRGRLSIATRARASDAVMSEPSDQTGGESTSSPLSASRISATGRVRSR